MLENDIDRLKNELKKLMAGGNKVSKKELAKR